MAELNPGETADEFVNKDVNDANGVVSCHLLIPRGEAGLMAVGSLFELHDNYKSKKHTPFRLFTGCVYLFYNDSFFTDCRCVQLIQTTKTVVMKILSTAKNINMMFQFIASIIFLFLPVSAMIAQDTVASSDKLKPFIGEWKLKGDVWKSKSNSVYKEDVNPNRSFVAKAVSPENTILWEENFDNGAWATLLWTYHKETGRVNHISNTTDNNIGIGVGEFDKNNDLTIKIVYPNGCTNCHRIYSFHWINAGEFDFKATIYKDEKPTGDFYGCTFVRKVSNGDNESSVKSVDIGVNVSDTTRAFAFYTKVFGMKRQSDWHASREMSVAAGVNSGRAFDIVNLTLDCDGYVLRYKLNQTQNNIDTIATNNKLPYYGFEKLGLGYLTFNVENVDPFIKRITENSITYKLVTLPGLRVILLHDPDGTLLEIHGK